MLFWVLLWLPGWVVVLLLEYDDESSPSLCQTGSIIWFNSSGNNQAWVWQFKNCIVYLFILHITIYLITWIIKVLQICKNTYQARGKYFFTALQMLVSPKLFFLHTKVKESSHVNNRCESIFNNVVAGLGYFCASKKLGEGAAETSQS